MQDLLTDNINTQEYWDEFYKGNAGKGCNNERNNFWLKWIPTHLPASLLEIGYGSDGGMVTVLKDLRPNIKMTALDFSSALIERDRIAYPSVDFACIDVMSYIPEQKFDIVMCQHVLEHFDNPQDLIDKVSKDLMANGGLFLLSLPHWGSFRSTQHMKAFMVTDILDLTDKDFYLLNITITDCGAEGQEMRFVLGRKGNGY